MNKWEVNEHKQWSLYIYIYISSGEAKNSNRSCYANLRLSITIKTIVNLHSMSCCYA